MSLRTSLAVAVFGALLIGGAATGTTLALWRDSTSVDAGKLSSGYMTLTVGGDTTNVVLGSVSGLGLGLGGAAGAAVPLTPAPLLKLDSLTSAKNLRMNVYLDSVTVPPDAALSGLLQYAVGAPIADGSCPAFGDAEFKDVGSMPATKPLLTNSPLAPQQTAKLCMSFRLKAGTTGSALGQSSTVRVRLQGVQYR